jgi:ParB family chromosome partitioning protein
MPKTTRTAPAVEPTDGTAATITWLATTSLEVDQDNARKTDTEPEPELVDSIKAVGVQIPLIVRGLDTDIIANQTAKEDNRPERRVPCWVLQDSGPGRATLVSLLENQHRREMTSRDTIAAVHQLSLSGMAAADLNNAAKAIGLRPEEIKHAKRAADVGDAALDRAAAYEFDLQELATLADFQDMPNAVRLLGDAKQRDAAENTGGGHWRHAVASLTQTREAAARLAARRAELSAAGTTVVDRRNQLIPLENLRTSLGSPISPEQHADTCEGHAAWIDPAADDEATVYGCVDPQKYDHTIPGPAVDPERVAAQAVAQQKNREEAAERKAHRRAWEAARIARRQYIKELCARKETTDQIDRFILSTVLGMPYPWTRWIKRQDTATPADYFGVPDPGAGTEPYYRSGNEFDPVVNRVGRARRPLLLLAAVASAYEYSVGHENRWDDPDRDELTWLTFLESTGYLLSEIEAHVVNKVRANPSKRVGTDYTAPRRQADAPDDARQDDKEPTPTTA